MRIGRVAALSSSATLTVVKRRASASSSAIVVRYSSGVVAPMTAMSPRASAGFSAWPAPTPPSLRPRLASRWISSRNRMIPGWLASATSWAIRSSSWPRYCVPALERGERHLDDPRATERGGDAPRDDPLGEALDDRGLADAGRSEQDGVALGAADEDLDHPGRLVLAPDRRPEEPLGGELRQVPAELVQERRGVRAGRRGARSRAVGRVRGRRRRRRGLDALWGGRLPRGPGRRSGGPAGDLGGAPRRVGQLVDAPLEPVEGKVEPGLVGAGRLGRGPNGRAGRASRRLGHAQWTRSRSAAVSGSFAAVTARPCPTRRSASPASRWPGPARCTPATCRSRSRARSRSSASCRARRP